MKKEIKFSLVFRDMWQSAGKYVPRVDQLVKVAPAIIEMGCFARVETNGGGFEQVNLLFGENPNKAVREWTKPFHEAGIQTHMLDRALNGLRMSPVPADVRKLFYKVKKAQGTDITRTFCGLNDTRNIIPSIGYAHDAGMISQCSLCITHSPIHTVEYYTEMALKLIKAGADEICIKDMAGLLSPYNAEKLVRTLKSQLTVPIDIHTHFTSGMGDMTYLKAIEAGVDMIDTALSPFAQSTGQPSTEAIVATLQGQPRDTGIELTKLHKAADYFRGVKTQLVKDFGLNDNIPIDPKVLTFQIPGGMLSNLLNQMKEMGSADKYPELLEEMPRVRAELGYPPLVTPTSQIVGSMAALNVTLGRYKMIPNEVKDLVRGKYGRTPAPIDPEVKKLAIGDEPQIDHRPADDIAPQMESLKAKLAAAGYPNADIDDVLSYALFPDVALAYFKKHR